MFKKQKDKQKPTENQAKAPKSQKKSKIVSKFPFSKKNKDPKIKNEHIDPTFGYAPGYRVTNSYLFKGKRQGVISIFDVLIAYGTNAGNDPDIDVGWTIRAIPTAPIRSGKVTFIQVQQQMDKKSEDKLIGKELSAFGESFTDQNEKETNARTATQNQQRAADFRLARQLTQDDSEVAIDTDMRLIIEADTPDLVEETLDELYQAYRDANIAGISFVRYTGQQLEMARDALTHVSADNLHPTDMSAVASGRVMLPSSGFSDEYGTLIGNDTQSYVQPNKSVLDAREVHNAIIFGGGTVPKIMYAAEMGRRVNDKVENGNGAWATWLAEKSSYLQSNRTHYIVLDNFDYRLPDSLTFDMSKHSINPLEVFGDKDTVVSDTNANIDKFLEMCMMLSSLDKSSDAQAMRVDLSDELMHWLTTSANGSGIYTTDPQGKPQDALRILAQPGRHASYPKMSDFLESFQARLAADTERARDRKTTLYKSLKAMNDRYATVFDRATTLPDSFKKDERNIYYDLSKIGLDKNVKGATFLNTLAFISNRALPGEQIVILTLDAVSVDPDVLAQYRKVLDRKSIGLITTFEDANNKHENPQTYVNFVKNYAKQDMVVLGQIDNDEVADMTTALWNGRVFPDLVMQYLRSSQAHLYYVYRQSDQISALVDTELVL